MAEVISPEIFGKVTTFKYDGGSMSAPAFMNMNIDTEDGPLSVFAQGKLAKKLFGKLSCGLHVTITLDGQRVTTFAYYGAGK